MAEWRIEEVKLVSQSDSLDSVRLSNLVKTAQIVEDCQDYSSLYGGDARLGSLLLPDAFGFGKEAMPQC